MKYHDGATVLPNLKCPLCGYAFDAASGISGKAAPESGDVSVCMACGEPAVFTGSEAFGYGVRVPTEEELATILADVRIAAARESIRFMRSIRETWPTGPRDR